MYINKLGGGITIPAQLQDYHCSSLKTLRSNQYGWPIELWYEI